MKKILDITKTAGKQLINIANNYDTKQILFYVKGGGCNGFNYQLKPTNKPAEKLDEVVKMNNVEIHVCNSSIMHLLGTKIDWTEDIMGQGFKFENPMAQSKCGCGTSFSSKAFL